MEVGYARNNVAPPYKNNRHPLWSVKLLDNGITILTPQDKPEWRMVFSTGINGEFPVAVMKGASLRGSGYCLTLKQDTPS